MTVLSIHNLSYQFDDGVTLFSNINAALAHPFTGLIGDNGAGKSTLVSILRGDIALQTGSVDITSSVIFVDQHEAVIDTQQSIAAFLGLDNVLGALASIRNGDCRPILFDMVGEQWQLEEELQSRLAEIGLPQDFNLPLSALSGGQRAKLRLYHAFNSEAELLVLDEPSNHLDTSSKLWLLDLIRNYDGQLLLISHDRLLLNEANAIWSIENKTLRVFGGNYDAFSLLHQQEADALTRQINNIEKQQNQLNKQHIQNQIKAQKRAQQGEKLRKSNSQPKCFLDAKKESAGQSAANRAKHHDSRKIGLAAQHQTLRAKQTQGHSVKLYTAAANDTKRTVFCVEAGELAYGPSSSLNMQVKAHEKVQLVGANGTGKSVLLKTLQGQIKPKSGVFRVNSQMFMLDQYYSLLRSDLTVLQNLEYHCSHLQQSEARTLLAGIGFKGVAVSRLARDLSGGERMKLAVTAVCHQQTQPFLLLDEPDNHLDINSKNALAAALSSYQGGFLLVSHDEDFVNSVGITRMLYLD